MLMDVKFIPEEIVSKIKEAAVLEDVIADYVQLNKKGSQLQGDCPSCNAKKKFEVSPSKKIAKCWVCNKSATDAISFLKNFRDIDYVPALTAIAERYHIDITTQNAPTQKTVSKSINRNISFRDRQLKESGIKSADQNYWLTEGNSEDKVKVECNRYQAASIDKKTWSIIPGDDMLLHYLDLDGNPIYYKDHRENRKPLIRIRWANPDLHGMKYQSPIKSGSHLWLPNWLIKAYKSAQVLDTLYIVEGEKKADKMCAHGLPTVGIMGIHNFANGEMPYVFERIIKKCAVVKVVFCVDSDWKDISTKDANTSVDIRPITFFKAVTKFRDYFKAFYASDPPIEIETYFSYGLNTQFKGLDDLLTKVLKDKEQDLVDDFKEAMLEREGKGKYVNVHKITELSSYKIKEYWHIQTPIAFMEAHKEKLKDLKQFKLGGFLRRWNEEDNQFEIDQKILPHETYWKKIYDGEDANGKPKYKYGFDYVAILEFLRNRGFGIYELSADEKKRNRYIKVEGRVIQETNPQEIQRYVIDFTREEAEKPVLELLLRGGKQYLGNDKLSNMYFNKPDFNVSDKNCHYLYFKNGYWKITADNVEHRPLNELPKHIWEEQIIDFEPNYLGKMIDVKRVEDNWNIKESQEFQKSDIALFYKRTSNFHFRKTQEVKKNEKGIETWQERAVKEEILEEDKKIMSDNLVAKMVAAGYLVHDHLDFANMKAVVCMDGLESTVGKSQGGTGKGVWCTQFEKIVKVHWINGKRKNLDEDKHLYAGVSESTKIIYFEDIRVNFDFEQAFPGITRGTWVEKKGVDGHKEAPKKHLLDTNHSLNGEGNSFWRRQYILSFSDYYNKNRTVADDFGCQFYEEWDKEQWNYFYNFIANCCQLYLKYRLQYSIPKGSLEKRKLRQQIGENFIEWATLVYDKEEGLFLNQKVAKTVAWEMYLEEFPSDRRYLDTKRFKDKLVKYAEYAELEFNPTTKGERIKSDNKEFFILADKDFNVSRYNTIRTKQDLENLITPLNPAPF